MLKDNYIRNARLRAFHTLGSTCASRNFKFRAPCSAAGPGMGGYSEQRSRDTGETTPGCREKCPHLRRSGPVLRKVFSLTPSVRRANASCRDVCIQGIESQIGSSRMKKSMEFSKCRKPMPTIAGEMPCQRSRTKIYANDRG